MLTRKQFRRLIYKSWRRPQEVFISRLYKTYLSLCNGQDNIVLGYGSLLNEKSARRSLTYAEDLGFDYLYGYRRVFNMGSVNSGFLNIEPSSDRIVVRKWNIVDHRDLAEYVIREANYNIKKVNDKIYCVCNYSWGNDIKPGLNYLATCLEELEGEFRENFLQTTYNADGELTANYVKRLFT